MMNTNQLNTLLSNDPITKSIFKGVFAKNELKKINPRKVELPAAYVANTHDSHMPGEHWVAFYFPKDRNGAAEFFDSFGITPIHEDFKHFLHKFKYSDFKFNNQQFQSYLTTVCGQYCAFFILCRSRNINYDDFCSQFDSNNREFNDSIVAKYINRYFSVDIPMIDLGFVVQVSRNKTN